MKKYIVNITTRVVVSAESPEQAKDRAFAFIRENECEYETLDYDTLEEVQP
jgi:hypothetical protein